MPKQTTASLSLSSETSSSVIVLFNFSWPLRELYNIIEHVN